MGHGPPAPGRGRIALLATTALLAGTALTGTPRAMAADDPLPDRPTDLVVDERADADLGPVLTSFAELDDLLTSFNEDGTISDRTTTNLRDRLNRARALADQGSETRTIGYLEQFVARVQNQVKGNAADDAARVLIVRAAEGVIEELQFAEDQENAENTGAQEWDTATGRLDPAAFAEPPSTSRPHAFWFWNGELTQAELERQLDEMAANGVEEFFIHPRQGLGGEFGVTENDYYLSTDYFDKVGFVLEQARDRGMKAWLYDDLNWPSGYAGGRTVRGGVVDGREIPADPDYVPWYLTPIAADVAGGTTYDAQVPLGETAGWRVQDGALSMAGGDIGFFEAGKAWTDYRMEFDLTVRAIAGGWTLRSADEGNLVMVNLSTTSPYNPEANSTFGVHVRVNGAYRLVGERPPAGKTIENGATYRVSTEVRGDTVIVSLDGTEVGRVSDPAIGALATGTVGFRMDAVERADVDNLRVVESGTGSTLLQEDFEEIPQGWDAPFVETGSSLVATLALPKASGESCVTGGEARGVALDGEGAVELTDQVVDGRLRWEAPEGDWCVVHLVQRPLLNYHPDLEPDELYVDMLNPAVTEKFIDITHETYADRFGDHFGSTIPGIFNDEPGFYNNFPDNRGGMDSRGSIPWTPGFRDYLTENAGYDLTRDLVAMWYDTGATTTTTRVAYYDALSDRYNEAHTVPLAEWAEEHDIALISNPLVEEDLGSHRLIEGGSWFEMQREYHLPGMDLISGLNTSAITPKLNSSVAHLFQRPRNLSESFGAFGWDLTMEEMKRTNAWQIAGGVDLIDNHAFYYSIDGQRAFESQPSQFFQNTLWPRFSEYAELTGRLVEPARGARPMNPVGLLYPSSSVMGTGTPWNVRGFAGNGAALGPIDSSWRDTSNYLLQSQLDFDYLDELALAGDEDLGVDLAVDAGQLALGDQRWQALVLPRTDVLDLRAVAMMERLVADGGTVVAVDGLATLEAGGDDAELRERLSALFGAEPGSARESVKEHPGGGLAAFLPTREGLAELLRSRVTPGVELAPRTPDVRVRHVKRAADDAFLVVNLAGSAVSTTATFDVAQTPELWDPETGEVRVAPVFVRGAEQTEVPLELEPYEAVWVVFRPGAHPAGRTAHLTATNGDAEAVTRQADQLRAIVVVDEPGEVYAVGASQNRMYGGKTTVDDALEPLALGGDWTFRFEKDGAEPVTRPLGSWTDLDPTYSGSGTYTKQFEVPAAFLDEGRRIQLDLGQVRELAAVSVNGMETQYLDWSPYIVDVTEQLEEGANTVSVTVTNTPTNAIEGRANPSGLLGPVALVPQRVVVIPLVQGQSVTSYELEVSPPSASARPGTHVVLTGSVIGIAPESIEGRLSVQAPDGWTVDPVELPVSVESSDRAVRGDYALTVSVPEAAAEGSYEVRVSFIGADGGRKEVVVPIRVVSALVAWEFETDGDSEGWLAANQVTPLQASGGAVRFSSTGGDPYVVGPQVDVSLNDGAVVEVVMTSSTAGQGQVFWATTQGGFAEARSGTFDVDAGTHTYRIPIPGQQASLRQLRLDPLRTTGALVVDAVRVLP